MVEKKTVTLAEAQKDRQPRKQPFEIDKAAIERLSKRIHSLTEARTHRAVKLGRKAEVYEAIGKERNDALIFLGKISTFLENDDTPPDGSDE